MSAEYTDSMTILDMLIEYEEGQIRRFHSKNTHDGEWPSDPEIREQAINYINSYTNVTLLEQMQFVMDERRQQRAKREKERLQMQEG